MSTDIIESRMEKPVVRDDWDYEKSVAMIAPVIGRWKSEAKSMVIPELWNAREHLDGRGGDHGNQYTGGKVAEVKDFTFATYCESIGITRQTGRNWLIESGLLLSGAHVTNNTGNQENFTPPKVAEAVRDVLGTIDLDPASCEWANETIGAKTIYTEEDDGLSKPWTGRVFMNPPYQQPGIRLFTEKLLEELPHIDEAIVLVNNNTDTRWFHSLALSAQAVCFTSGRIKFYTKDNPETAPTNGQTFFYFGTNAGGFSLRFRQLGLIMRTVISEEA